MVGTRYFIWALVVAAVLLPEVAQAQGVNVNTGAGTVQLGPVHLIAAITLLGALPALLMTVTCFPLIVTVLSIFRFGLGLQTVPSNQIILGLGVFLTWYVMEPTFMASWNTGIKPFFFDGMPPDLAISNAVPPFRTFMMGRVDADVLDGFLSLNADRSGAAAGQVDLVPLRVLVPSFVISEITRAFELGFYVIIPFLLIDIVISAVLMSMGMMMVPPSVVSLPFKIAFLVLSDGFFKISMGLVRGYS